MYPEKPLTVEAEKTDAINEEEKIVNRIGSLKKNYFKPIQKVYESSLSAQINEIKTENRKVIRSSPSHSSYKGLLLSGLLHKIPLSLL